jgi:hypothetical protein
MILLNIFITFCVWAIGCYVVQEYEFFNEFAEKFPRPIELFIKILYMTPYVGLIIVVTTICLLLCGCIIGIIILYPISCITSIFEKDK